MRTGWPLYCGPRKPPPIQDGRQNRLQKLMPSLTEELRPFSKVGRATLEKSGVARVMELRSRVGLTSGHRTNDSMSMIRVDSSFTDSKSSLSSSTYWFLATAKAFDQVGPRTPHRRCRHRPSSF